MVRAAAARPARRLGVFERYLSLWVGLCMVAGVGAGLAMPGVVSAFRGLEFGAGSQINVPIALLICLMIVPMMTKVAFAPIVRYLVSGASSLAVPFTVLAYSVGVFIVIPLVAGVLLRRWLVGRHGRAVFAQAILPRFAPVSMAALLLTLVCIFAFQAGNIVGKPFHVALIAVPILVQVYFNSSLT